MDSSQHAHPTHKAPATTAGRDALAASDFVLSAERVFPITSPADVKNAVASWGRYRGPTSFATFKQRLIALATRKGYESALPKEWQEEASTKPGNTYRSIQNPRQYRALRKRGYSKDAAARISNAQSPDATVKANYGARAGQVIAGRLVRGGDGKFSSGGGAGASPPKPKRTRTARAPKQTPEQRDTAKREEQATNRTRVARDIGLPANELDALDEFASPDEKITLSPANATALEKKGLVEKGADGEYRMTTSGRQVLRAAEQGDARAAADALSRGTDRASATQDRTAARQARIDAVRQKRQEREAARLAKEQEPKAGGGGGGSKDTAVEDAQKRQAQLQRQRQQQALAAQSRQQGRIRQQGAAAQVAERLAQQLSQQRQQQSKRTKAQPPAFTVFKDARGQWRWVGLTSNGYEDRDKEIVSTKALAADVARADADKQYGPLRWWHIGDADAADPVAPWGPGLDLGWCDFNAMSGPFLVESGTFISEKVARAIVPIADQLGLSPGFFHPATEPSADGVFTHIRRFERSLAPRSVVSNRFTSFSTLAKEQRMDDTAKVKQFAALTGMNEADVLALIATQTETRQKEAQAAGIRLKATATPAAQPAMIIDGQVYILASEKAPPPPPPPAAEAADGAADEAADEDEDIAEMAGGDLLDMTRDEFKALLVEALAPIVGQLKVADKMEGMLKALGEEVKASMGGVSKKTAATDATLDDLKARVKTAEDALKIAVEKLAELNGDAPALVQRAGYRASADPASTLPAQVAQALTGKTTDGNGTQQTKAAETLEWFVQRVTTGSDGSAATEPPNV